MANLKKRPVTRSVEVAIIQHLKTGGSFKGCAIIAKGDSKEAPEQLPCIIVECPSAPRHGDVIGFYPRDAEVVVTLYCDSEQTNEATAERYARNMENMLDWTAGLKVRFNPPASGRDTRKIRGVYLHEIIDFSTEYQTEGTIWQRSARLVMVIQEFDES